MLYSSKTDWIAKIKKKVFVHLHQSTKIKSQKKSEIGWWKDPDPDSHTNNDGSGRHINLRIRIQTHNTGDKIPTFLKCI